MQNAHFPQSVKKTLLDGVTLTDAYAGNVSDSYENKAVGITDKASFSISYTPGATETNNELHLQVEVSPTGEDDDWDIATTQSTSGGEVTIAKLNYKYIGATAVEQKISVPFEINDNFIRVSAKEVGVATNFGTLTLKITLTGN